MVHAVPPGEGDLHTVLADDLCRIKYISMVQNTSAACMAMFAGPLRNGALSTALPGRPCPGMTPCTKATMDKS